MTKITFNPSKKTIQKAEEMVSLHNNGLTWEEIHKKFSISISYMYALKKWYLENKDKINKKEEVK